MPKPPIDMTGQRFGAWTVLQLDRSDKRRVWWLVRCDCGVEASVRGDSLRGGRSTKCLACQSAELTKAVTRHGEAHSPTHMSWTAMRTRCGNPNAADYPNYGGRGVTVCDHWQVYENFVADMGHRPAGTSLDRIDVNGNYEPANCRWSSQIEQGRNRRRTVFLEANGKRQALSAWAVELGIAHITLFKRREAGWPDDLIVNTPVLPRNSPKPRSSRRTAASAS